MDATRRSAAVLADSPSRREEQSRNRQRVFELEARRAALLEELVRPPPRFFGSLIVRWKTCGKAGCRCARGERHGPFAEILRSVGGQRSTEPVERADLDAVKRAAAADRQWRRWLRELREIAREVDRRLRALRSGGPVEERP